MEGEVGVGERAGGSRSQRRNRLGWGEKVVGGGGGKRQGGGRRGEG